MYDIDRDILIIGAGLLGCAAARSLARYDLKVTVLEMSSDVSTGISKANSGIIYAGYDDEPGSLKAGMVVRANARLADLCRELGVRYRRTGSIMVGYGDRSSRVIEKKYEQGLANGVPGLELLDGDQAAAREPLLTPGIRTALYAPTTATVDPWELCIALYENARSNGAEFCLDSEVKAVRRIPGGFIAETDDGIYPARAIINCAGLSADIIREMTESPRVRIIPNACDYAVLGIPAGSGPSMVIFHEPEYKGKGLTLIPTVSGEVLAGSTQRDPYNEGGNPTSEEGLRRVMELCSRIVPDMPVTPVIHSFAALRPNPFEIAMTESGSYEETGRRLRDFTVLEENGLFSLMGIKTPGLTCCVELGEYITERVLAYTGVTDLNTDFDPVRRGIRRLADIPYSELARAVSDEPGLGRVICSCRMVSEYEIREAVRSGARTLGGVKRRTGVLMGHCQGSKCLSEILGIMSEELGIPQSDIVMDSPSSEVIR